MANVYDQAALSISRVLEQGNEQQKAEFAQTLDQLNDARIAGDAATAQMLKDRAESVVKPPASMTLPMVMAGIGLLSLGWYLTKHA